MQTQINLNNPGEFFAACGILGLAYQAGKWKIKGCFRDRNFILDGVTETDFPSLFEGIKIRPEGGKDKGRDAVILAAPQWRHELRIDYWRTPEDEASRRLKTWAAQSTPSRIISDAYRHLPTTLDDIFSAMAPLDDRFGYDSSYACTTLDYGFSPALHGYTIEGRPGIEFLAPIGLQFARPTMLLPSKRYTYRVWHEPSMVMFASTVGDYTDYIFSRKKLDKFRRYFGNSFVDDKEIAQRFLERRIFDDE